MLRPSDPRPLSVPNNQQPATDNRACYLVTGAAGFIAAKVCEQLLAAGHRVVGVDNLNDYYDVRLKDYRLSQLLRAKSLELSDDPKRSVHALRSQPLAHSSGNFTFHHADIENLAALEAIFSAHTFDAVFNLAARAGVRYSLEFPELYRRTNVLGEENVLKCQVKFGVKKHVLASSSSVYAGCPMPFTEDAPLGKMQSPYAETKRAAELLAKEYHDRHGLEVTVLRYFTVFGPAGRPDMAPFRFIKWIAEGTPITLYGDGNQARDFTYVDDIARGTVLAARPPARGKEGSEKSEGGSGKSEEGSGKSEEGRGKGSEPAEPLALSPSPLAELRTPRFEILNLGGGNNPLTISAMIEIIEQALGKKARIDQRPTSAADMKETWADISKAKRLLGWSPQVTPEDGFRKAVGWYLENREWLKKVKV